MEAPGGPEHLHLAAGLPKTGLTSSKPAQGSREDEHLGVGWEFLQLPEVPRTGRASPDLPQGLGQFTLLHQV